MGAQAAQSGPFVRVSTQPVPARDRLDFWRGLFGNVDIQTLDREGGRDFRADFAAFGDPNGSRFITMKSDANVARFTDEPDEFVMLSGLNAGRAVLPGRDGDTDILPDGTLYLMDAVRRPTVISHGHHHTYLVLRRSSVVRAMGGDGGLRRLGVVTLPRTGLTQVLWSHLRAVSEQVDKLNLEEAASAVGAAETLALSVLRQAHAEARDSDDAGLVIAARRLIAAGRSNWSAQRLARRLGVSRTRLFAAFQGQGLSIAETVRRERFERARTLLADPARSTEEIAYLIGYADASAFGKAFRRSCGLTPTEWRRAEAPLEKRR